MSLFLVCALFLWCYYFPFAPALYLSLVFNSYLGIHCHKSLFLLYPFLFPLYFDFLYIRFYALTLEECIYNFLNLVSRAFCSCLRYIYFYFFSLIFLNYFSTSLHICIPWISFLAFSLFCCSSEAAVMSDNYSRCCHWVFKRGLHNHLCCRQRCHDFFNLQASMSESDVSLASPNTTSVTIDHQPAVA